MMIGRLVLFFQIERDTGLPVNLKLSFHIDNMLPIVAGKCRFIFGGGFEDRLGRPIERNVVRIKAQQRGFKLSFVFGGMFTSRDSEATPGTVAACVPIGRHADEAINPVVGLARDSHQIALHALRTSDSEPELLVVYQSATNKRGEKSE